MAAFRRCYSKASFSLGTEAEVERVTRRTLLNHGRAHVWLEEAATMAVDDVEFHASLRARQERDSGNVGRLTARWLAANSREAVANVLTAFAEKRLSLGDLLDVAGEADGSEPLWQRSERLLDAAGAAPDSD